MKKIPAKLEVTSKEYDIITRNYGDNPCNVCGLSLTERSTCYGCPTKNKWEQQFENIPNELLELAKTYNQLYVLDDRIKKLNQDIEKIQSQKEEILQNIGEIIIKNGGKK